LPPTPIDPTPQPPTPIEECEETIEITPDNAADVLCALSQYLGQLANGEAPDLGVEPENICFCFKYN
jgi:hypothetical protein